MHASFSKWYSEETCGIQINKIKKNKVRRLNDFIELTLSIIISK